MIKIVDMDEVSEGERNSEDGMDDEEEADGVGNDIGDINGLGGGVELVVEVGGKEGEVVKPEQVGRWGVVLVEQERLDGRSFRVYICSELIQHEQRRWNYSRKVKLGFVCT
jgi:hypothetical protein